MTEKKKYLPIAAIAAVALVAAACGGNDGGPAASSSSVPATTVKTPTATTAANAVALPEGHGLTESGEYTIDAGTTMKVAGVRFSCMGDADCAVTVTVDADGMASAESASDMVRAHWLNETGAGSFAVLSDALREEGAYDETDSAADLMTRLYHDVDDVPANDQADPPVVAVDNGGGVTSSVTTHDEPDEPGDDGRVTGVSDIAVTVAPAVVRARDGDASTTVLVFDADGVTVAEEDATDQNPADADATTDPWVIMNAVLVDDDGNVTSTRTANFVADADWARNPAAEWTTDPALMGATQNMDVDEDDIWTNYFQATQDLDGGRTLHLDLRSDFDPNNIGQPMDDQGNPVGMVVARGPGSEADGDPAVRVKWADISFDGIGDLPVGSEIDLGSDGIKGTYMGVRGTFACMQLGADELQICRVNHHTPMYMTPSEDDLIEFTPDVYTPDSDWLAAGVWLTVPDDTADGDYAIGAFVYGNDPYKPAASDARTLTGTATYAGQAFGRYAEVDGDHTEVGRFTAAAMLTADFGDDAETGNDFGTIHGDLTGFVANGQMEDWDVNFEQAMIMLEGDDNDPPGPIDNTALRFNGGASGHARGHAMDGYWNGQFYGTPADGAVDDDLQPGSAAGTFGLTDRDKSDDYSLTVGGAFATHKQAEE